MRAPAHGGASPEAVDLADVSVQFAFDDIGALATELWSRLQPALAAVIGPATEPPSPRYTLPAAAQLSNYLLRLEQLLAVRCAAAVAKEHYNLSGEREILRGMLALAVAEPQCLPARLLLNDCLLRFHGMRPEIAAEFREQATLLQTRYPLADQAAAAVLAEQLTHLK